LYVADFQIGTTVALTREHPLAAGSVAGGLSVFYYCRTYYKAVLVGGEENGGHVLRKTTSRGLCVWDPCTDALQRLQNVLMRDGPVCTMEVARVVRCLGILCL
jgi:hypothetical protein